MTSFISNSSKSFARGAAGLRFSGAQRRLASSISAGVPAWSRLGGSAAENSEDLVASFWTPGLLDHLQEPVTRYHE